MEHHSLCSFDKAFRELILSTFGNHFSRSSIISTEGNSNEGQELECDELPDSIGLGQSPAQEAELAEEFEKKICLVPATALVCLRMAMKFSESQENIFANIVP